MMTFKRLFPANVVPNTSTKMYGIDTTELTELFVSLTVATAALTNFTIKAKPHPDTVTALTLYSVAGDFTSPQGLLVGASGDLTIQGVGTGWFIMDVKALKCVELWATSGGTATLALEIGGA